MPKSRAKLPFDPVVMHLQYGTFSMAPSVWHLQSWHPQIRHLQIGLAVLVRWIVLVGKILSIPHHLHDVDGAGSMGNHATSGRTGTDRHHAGHGDRSRNNCGRENNGELAHLALLSKTLSLRCGNGQASRELPPLKLFWGENARLADIALCPAAHPWVLFPRVRRLGIHEPLKRCGVTQLTCGRVYVRDRGRRGGSSWLGAYYMTSKWATRKPSATNFSSWRLGVHHDTIGIAPSAGVERPPSALYAPFDVYAGLRLDTAVSDGARILC